MFAYCNNNPANMYDQTGLAPLNLFYRVDGAGSSRITTFSDGINGSNELLDYVSKNYIQNTNSVINISVRYMGIYSHAVDATLSYVSAGTGIAELLISHFLPGIKEVRWLESTLNVIGVLNTLYGAGDLLFSTELPEKDYYQYKVTMTWSEQELFSYPNVFIRTDYLIEMWFLWDDTSYTSPQWYKQSSSLQEKRTLFNRP